MSIYHEDFDGGGGGEGTFFAYGAAPFISPLGNPNNCADLGNAGYYRDLLHTYSSTRFSCNVKVGSNYRPSGQLILMRNSALANTPNIAQQICQLQFEPDRSISVYISGRSTVLANTQNAAGFSYGTNEWFDLQWVVVMSAVVVGLADILHIKTSLSINGVPIFTDVEANTDIDPFHQPSGLTGSNLHIWEGVGQGSIFVDNITVETASVLDSDTSVFQAVVSQAVLETVESPTDAIGVVSQGVVELAELPTDSSVIITQAVIELVGQVVTHGGGGWRVYEA